MRNRRIVLGGMAASLVMGGVSYSAAHAATVPQQHIKGHLRVDGSSDLRGKVRSRGGLQVTAGLITDTLNATGPVQLGGTLTVAGAASTNGLNAGAGVIATTAGLQGGSLSIAGDASLGGGLTVARRIGANGADVGAGGLHVVGAVDAGSAAVSGTLSAGSFSTQGAMTAGSATFNKLDVSPGGSINFNNASITGVSGLSLGANPTLSSLKINPEGTAPALTITAGGKSDSLLIDGNGDLYVSGAGLNVQKDLQTNNAFVYGSVFTSSVGAANTLALHAPDVTTSNNLDVGSSGNLKLTQGSSAASHVVGNRDTRGTCTVSASTGSVNTCSISFSTAYGSVPIVVATPTGGAPGLVSGYSVQSSTSGFSILFTVSQAASVTFNYMVQQ